MSRGTPKDRSSTTSPCRSTTSCAAAPRAVTIRIIVRSAAGAMPAEGISSQVRWARRSIVTAPPRRRLRRAVNPATRETFPVRAEKVNGYARGQIG
ncbi:hypothetical protein GCM10010168_92270 [Actinoplanes ianthinogenes]|uniref:Uncharacterized protein n=1 Tax=Actinoplanes ianthinogenes TaxID=122358 RepID=A0ABM7LK20_9ACTN|nr:hypothetical protein Aiant_02510 [Actinoplanes ianthinogenes]GGR58891.1 hypothetical protein GCM10010168_92270 [Actinoplanes ianthinogenes]